MKILFFTYRFWPEVGGVEKYIHCLARALQRMGHHVRLLTVSHRDGLANRGVHDGVEIHRFPGHRSPTRAWAGLMGKRELFDWADIVHISDTHVLEYFYRMAAWAIGDKPVYMTRHGLSCVCPVPAEEKRRAHRALGLADGLIHDGYFIEKWLGVKPDLVPDQGLWPEPDEIPETPEPSPTSATFVGRLGEDSGIRIYIDAIAMLRSQHHTPIHLNVYGGGPLEDELRDRVRRDELPVTFHGWQPDAQERITDTCFAFIAGRMAIQEAMARRRLVVAAYPTPLKRDYVQGEPFGPYLVSGGDAETIAKGVAYYAQHGDERRQLIADAHAHVSDRSWTRTAAAYVSLWTRPLPNGTVLSRMSRIERIRLALRLRGEAHAAVRRERKVITPTFPATAQPA